MIHPALAYRYIVPLRKRQPLGCAFANTHVPKWFVFAGNPKASRVGLVWQRAELLQGVTVMFYAKLFTW